MISWVILACAGPAADATTAATTNALAAPVRRRPRRSANTACIVLVPPPLHRLSRCCCSVCLKVDPGLADVPMTNSLATSQRCRQDVWKRTSRKTEKSSKPANVLEVTARSRQWLLYVTCRVVPDISCSWSSAFPRSRSCPPHVANAVQVEAPCQSCFRAQQACGLQ